MPFQFSVVGQRDDVLAALNDAIAASDVPNDPSLNQVKALVNVAISTLKVGDGVEVNVMSGSPQHLYLSITPKTLAAQRRP